MAVLVTLDYSGLRTVSEIVLSSLSFKLSLISSRPFVLVYCFGSPAVFGIYIYDLLQNLESLVGWFA